MRRRSLALVLVPFFATALFAQEKPFNGTWKLNAAKSKSDGPAWKSRTLTISSDGDTRKFKSDGVNQDGMQLTGGYEAKSDGKDYPMTGNLAGGDTIALKETSPRTVTFTIKKAGKVVTSGRSVVSPDGKALTITSKGTTADGKHYTSTAVYDKS
jgi:hypothetical protein